MIYLFLEVMDADLANRLAALCDDEDLHNATDIAVLDKGMQSRLVDGDNEQDSEDAHSIL